MIHSLEQQIYHQYVGTSQNTTKTSFTLDIVRPATFYTLATLLQPQRSN